MSIATVGTTHSQTECRRGEPSHSGLSRVSPFSPQTRGLLLTEYYVGLLLTMAMLTMAFFYLPWHCSYDGYTY